MNNNESKNSKSPISNGWITLGEGKGIRWVLWNNSVVLQRKEKEDNEWGIKEEIHLAPRILKEISWRIPNWLIRMENVSNGDGNE